MFLKLNLVTGDKGKGQEITVNTDHILKILSFPQTTNIHMIGGDTIGVQQPKELIDSRIQARSTDAAETEPKKPYQRL
jgi:uncharacterized protein YlzI (FlbEa/FlbD family)